MFKFPWLSHKYIPTIGSFDSRTKQDPYFAFGPHIPQVSFIPCFSLFLFPPKLSLHNLLYLENVQTFKNKLKEYYEHSLPSIINIFVNNVVNVLPHLFYFSHMCIFDVPFKNKLQTSWYFVPKCFIKYLL